jgi:DNA polymerase/3'-5' exonuclease PolX
MTSVTKLSVMLAKEFEMGMTIKKDESKFNQPPEGWWASEKFDGYRALFRYEDDGSGPVGKFYSRAGKPFNAPEWFLRSMPPPNLLGNKILDGELWAGRENFQLMGVVRKKKPVPEEWLSIQYQVYDITNGEGNFTTRLKDLIKIVNFTGKAWQINLKNGEVCIPGDFYGIKPPLVFAKQLKINGKKMMKSFYDDIIENGGEGIMLKHPLSKYENGRSNYLLKYKPAFDREAIIIDYKLGEGKYTGLLGSFICKPLINHDTYMSVDPDENHIFTLSGMDDKIRNSFKETHPEGTIITFECSGFTDKGVPRFGRYQRIRDDVILKDHIEDPNSRVSLDKVISIMKKLEEHYKANYDAFRAKTYMTVNKALKTLDTDTDLDPKNLKSVKGIGQGTIDRIKEIIDTGTLQEYEKVKDIVSPMKEFLKIHGVGKQHGKKLVAAGFKTIDDLRSCESIKDHLNDTQLKGLKYFDDIQQRIPYQEIQNHEAFLKDLLRMIDIDAELTIAGSYRRKSKDSGDIDLLLKASSKKTYDIFIDSLKKSSYLVEDLARGSKKYMGLGKGIDSPYLRRIDIMYTKPEEYPFAILYFTGSGDFNVRMREDALKQGYTMNEYSMKHTETKEVIEKTFKTEREIFDFLGWNYVEPEMRIQ